MNRITLRPGYSISRIIKGGWHLAGGHGTIDTDEALADMRAFVEAGITTFDCADIYTGVEELIGHFLKKHKSEIASGELPEVQVHTKYVPDYDALSSLTAEDTTRIIDRSLRRLGVERLDMVQFAWWDYDRGSYVDAAGHLADLQRAGKIRYIGVTNFDGAHLQELLDAGIDIIANQVQYSVLDRRVEQDSNHLMAAHDIKYLCYGTVAGGFLSDRYLGAADPTPPLENRSLTKYRLIIDEYGGYDLYQQTLQVLREIADKHKAGVAEIACAYILTRGHVGGAIVGARNRNHLQRLAQISGISLDADDIASIQQMISQSSGPSGPFYELERDKTGRHGTIMKYNLNAD